MTTLFSSLRSRLVLLVLLAVAPAFVVILYSAESHRDLTASQVQANALYAARGIVSEQERVFANAHELLVMLSRVPQVRAKNETVCHRFLAGLLEPLYADLGVATTQGELVCSALPRKNSLVRPKGPHHTQSVETLEFAIGEVRHNRRDGKTTLDLAYPVLDSPGTPQAVVMAVLDLSWMTRLSAGNHIPRDGSFSLVDANGTVLMRYPNGTDWIGKPIFAEVPIEGLISQNTEQTLEAWGADGVSRLFAFNQLRNQLAGRTVFAAVDVPSALAFAEANRILTYNLITLAILSILILTAAWFGADVFVVGRIRDLVGATKRVADGELSTRTKLPYDNGELGQLARAFDDLAVALETREREAEKSAQKIRRQRDQQNALYYLNLAITSTLDLARVLDTLMNEVDKLFPNSATTVSWINKQTSLLEPIVSRHFTGARNSNDAASELGLPLLVLKRQSAFAVPHAQRDPRTTNPEFFRYNRFESYLGLPLMAKGKPLGVLSIFTQNETSLGSEELDFLTTLVNQAAIAIDNSRLFEETRAQAIQLEKSNRIKDEFLGVMSHELRTPLNIIMNYSEALNLGTFGSLSDDQNRATDKIFSQAQHLLVLINGILETTKIESGSVTLHTEPIDIVSFLDEHRSDYLLPRGASLKLHWDYPSDLPVVNTDRMKLKHIVTNLINNAVKFTDTGSVTISAHAVDSGRSIEISVADTGPGIPPESLPHVFDKFRQIDSTTTRHFSGTGLGLYIVKTFVEVLGGTIAVRSTLGTGTMFTLQIPLKLESGARYGQRESLSVPHAAER